VKLEFLGDAALTEGERTARCEEIPAGDTATAVWTVKANAGSAKLFVRFMENGGETLERAGKAASGKPGWVSGDIHVHSNHSDGSGTMAENFSYGNKAGLDFINIADHDKSSGWDEAVREGPRYGIIPVRGTEFAWAPTGHAVFMDMEHELDSYGRLKAEAAFTHFKNITGGRGLIYLAHPYDGPSSRFFGAWDWELNGLEIWNSWFAPNAELNRKARARWDKLNREGKRLYGITATDTHMPEGVGASYTTVFAETIDKKGILAAMRRGRMYGSNGPVIGFNAGSAMMGDELKAKPSGETVAVRMTGEYVDKLDRLVLIKNGDTVVSKHIGAETFDEYMELDVIPGDFIRMEVFGYESPGKTLTDYWSYNSSVYFTAAAFAFSNPIFII